MEPTGASILLGKYFKLPLASATETTWTMSWPGGGGGGAPPVGIGIHPAGQEAAAGACHWGGAVW